MMGTERGIGAGFATKNDIIAIIISTITSTGSITSKHTNPFEHRTKEYTHQAIPSSVLIDSVRENEFESTPLDELNQQKAVLFVIHPIQQCVVISEAARDQFSEFLELSLVRVRRSQQWLHPALHQIELCFQYIQQ